MYRSDDRRQDLQQKAGVERNQLVQKTQQLTNTIETPRLELTRLRSNRFESVQGEIRYVIRGGSSGSQLVSINLGSAGFGSPQL